MGFKFRTIDLFAVTGAVAVLAAAYQTDLIFFRQLLCLSLVAIFSFAAVVIRRNQSTFGSRIAGLIGGLVGAAIYTSLALVFATWFFDSFDDFDGMVLVFRDVSLATVFSMLYGAVVGPLLGFYFRIQPLDEEFQKPFWISVLLFGGVLLILFFAMMDRISFHPRDWSMFVVLVTLVFVIQGVSWICRFENTRKSQT